MTIAVLASYAALDLAGRVTSSRGRTRAIWLSGGATAMGLGIWSMHYVGMLAFELPVPVLYDWPLVLASLLAAVGASAIALFVVSRKTMGVVNAVAGSVCMGGAIAGMHYTGMAANAFACNVPLLGLDGECVSGIGDGDFAGGAAIDVLLPKGKERVQLVEGG